MTKNTRLECISLRTVKYDDRRSIVTVWSPEAGRLGLLVQAGAGREAMRRRALMMPMGVFECEADVRPGRELLTVRDVRAPRVRADLAANPAKAVVCMFLAEVLERVLRDMPPDGALGRFIVGSIDVLDSVRRPRAIAAFPLVFLAGLAELMGISPDLSSWRPGRIFDMDGACFRDTAPTDGRWLGAEEAAVGRILMRLSYDSAGRLAMSRTARRRALDLILEYFGRHNVAVLPLRSLEVVREIF